MCNDVYGAMFPQLVRNCPDALLSLTLHDFGSQLEDEQPPRHSAQGISLLARLSALTQLTLANCVVTFNGDEITHLIKLHSLSLTDSEIYVDGQLEVAHLTNLTYLDLNGAVGYWEDAWVEASDSFTAWPRLEVLKLLGCNLIDEATILDVASVQELHVAVLPNIDAHEHQQLHAYMSMYQVRQRFFESGDFQLGKAIVSLNLTAPGEAINAELWRIVDFCPFLRSLRLLPMTCTSAVVGSENLLCLGGRQLALKLIDLSIEKHQCSEIDLMFLTCLTRLVLRCVDEQGCLACVRLPSCVKDFTFKGVSLFVHVENNLDSLSELTKITFEPYARAVRVSNQLVQPDLTACCLPQLPPSLRHLSVVGTGSERVFDWSGLYACTNLERLTLSRGHEPSSSLQAWIASAHHLYVVDHEGDALPLKHGRFWGTRMQWYS